jgi:hypothetical protein
MHLAEPGVAALVCHTVTRDPFGELSVGLKFPLPSILMPQQCLQASSTLQTTLRLFHGDKTHGNTGSANQRACEPICHRAGGNAEAALQL